MQLHFDYPPALWGFFGVAFLVAVFIYNRVRHPESFYWRRFFLITLCLSLCVLGLSRPQLGRTETQTQSVRSNVFFALDISKSMLAEDIGPSRLAFATSFVRKLLEQVSGVKVALFPFTVDGFIQMPLTADLAVMNDMLLAASPTMTTNQGTDLSNCLELLFQNIGKMELATTSKGADWFPTQVVLLSDGESHWPIKDSILRLYKSKSIPIFTVGVGTTAGATIPGEVRFGQAGEPLRDRDGKPVRSKLNSETLKKISDATGGDYFASRFEEVYPLAKKLTQSMKLSRLTTSFRAERELYPTLFLLALLLLCLEMFFGRWDYVIRMLIVGFIGMGVSPTLHAADGKTESDPNRAYTAFNEGVANLKQKELPKAAELFQESALLAPDKVLKKKALFNLGDAMIRLSDPQAAIPVLQEAYDLKTGDTTFDKETNAKISDNLGLAAKLLEQLQKQSQQGEGKDPSGGNQAGQPPPDPKGPKKDYRGQLFSDSQKQRIFDLISNDEQQTIQRLNDQKNKKSQAGQEKPW